MIVETDCAIAAKDILGGLKIHTNRDLISRIRELYKRDWHVIIQKISREANCASYILASLMKEYPIGPRVFYLDFQSFRSNLNDNSIRLHLIPSYFYQKKKKILLRP